MRLLSKFFVTLQAIIIYRYVMDSFQWLKDLFTTTDSVAHIALLYAMVIAAGVYLGKIKIGGISLGVTFVLFAGIIAGHIGFTAPTPILTFIQDFGLILFVFMIGMQVGPGFFESFGKAGIKLNVLAATAILLNIIVMFACYYLVFDTSDPHNLPMMVGTLYGAVTNTPGLGAANEALGCPTDCFGLCLCLPTRCAGHYRCHHINKVYLQGQTGERGCRPGSLGGDQC